MVGTGSAERRVCRMKGLLQIYLFRKKTEQSKSRHNPTSYCPTPKDENGKLGAQGIP